MSTSKSVPLDLINSLTKAEWIAIWRELRLSPREIEIAEGVIRRLSDIEIARELGISKHTVHTHIDRLYKKVGANNRTELVLRAFASYVSQVRSKDCESE